MLPNNVQRSDASYTPRTIPFIQNIFKCLIILIFPACLLEPSWLVGSYEDSVIYCGLTHTVSDNRIIQYDSLCNNNVKWACELYSTAYNTRVCLIIYYVLYTLYTTLQFISILYPRILQYLKHIPEAYIIPPLNIFLYIILLCFANFIPHKFENTLVEFDSSFGVAYICCNLHIADSIQTIGHTLYTSFEIQESMTRFYDKIKGLSIIERSLFISCTLQLFLNFPLFLKPDNFSPQNISPLFAILWIFQKQITLYYTYISLTLFVLFSNTFRLSMMKQSKYETATEVFVNVIFVSMFILHFVSLGLLYLTQHAYTQSNSEETTQRPKLSKHLHTIKAANRLTQLHNQDPTPTENNVTKFTIT